MRRTLLPVLALLALASPGSAQDIRMRWNNCFGVGTSAINKNYACDGSLDGVPQRVVCSFVAPAGFSAFLAMQAVVSLESAASVLPDWWRFGIGECRDGFLNFPASMTGVGNTTTCRNPWTGAAWVGASWEYHSEVLQQHQAQFVMVQHRDAPIALTAGGQYLAGVFELRMDKDVDIGQGSCAGCEIPGCLALRRVTLYQAPGASPSLVALETYEQYGYITWEGGPVGGVECPPFATPPPYPVGSQQRTWGAIKALYR